MVPPERLLLFILLIFALHFHKHAVELFHFLDSLLVLIQNFDRRHLGLLLPRFEQRSLVSFLDFFDCVWVDVVVEVRGLELLEAVAHFLFRRKLQKVFKFIPLIVSLVDEFGASCFLVVMGVMLRGLVVALLANEIGGLVV